MRFVLLNVYIPLKRKMMKNKVRFRNDLILIGVLLIGALVIFLLFKGSLKSGNKAVITVNGEKVSVLKLNEERNETIKTENGVNTVKIKDGKVIVADADCPDKICVNHRPISKVGDTIICLPHKLVVEIAEEE